MKSIHSTMTHVMTYLRILTLLIFSFFFVLIIPFLGLEAQEFLQNILSYLGFLYAILMGFLMNIAIQRRRLLDDYISKELNTIRRIYHLSLHIAKDQPKLEQWTKNLKEDLDAYLTLFRDASFYVYERGNELFRQVTYTIYRMPMLKVRYNQDIYKTLLETTGEATEARQMIRQKKDQYVGHFQWAITMILTFTFAWILTSATPADPSARVVTAIAIFNILLVLDLLYEYDRFNDKKLRYIANMYANNLANVEELKTRKYRKTK
ncbi:hypothetical protein GF380_01250 [Candidatus Uhrbacteria bacterium]|nr:hypothetical protein [Candidatus Uhrbacteria bacterium]MBD3283911.1 hypothetical protein [Candidatus Uhrbacteria bacterium]